jgi:glycosyltransferase involved in cell wall biosynthesis
MWRSPQFVDTSPPRPPTLQLHGRLDVRPPSEFHGRGGSPCFDQGEVAMARIRVLQVAMRLDPAIGGSTASTISNIVAEQRCGVDNTVVFAAGADDDVRTRPVVERLHTEGAVVKRFPRAARPSAASAQFGLSRSAARWLAHNVWSFDVVHAHGPWGATSAWSLLVARRHGVPTIVTAREQLTAHDRDTSQSRVRALAKTAAWKVVPALADVVVYTSQLESDASSTTGRLGSRIIWHAVVDDAKELPAPHLRDASSRHIVAGFLGRFDPKKNIHLLLDAVATDSRLCLVLAGGGNAPVERALRSQAVRLRIDDRVAFLGFISADDRSRFFAQIDVLVLPSNFENFGMAAAEAMEHGVPVIVSNRTGIAELLRVAGGGVTVTHDATAIASEMLRLGSRARHEAFALEVQRIALDRLSFTAHGKQAVALYVELADAAARRD